MKTTILKSAALWLAAVMALAFASCSKGGDSAIQSAIPANSLTVVKIDGSKVLEALDTKVSASGEVTMPAELKDAMKMSADDEKELSSYVKLLTAADYKCVYLVSATGDGNGMYVLCQVKNRGDFESTLTGDLGYVAADVEAPFDGAYISDETLALLKGDLAWLTPKANDPSFIKSQLDEAAKGDISSVPGVGDALSGSKAMFALAANVKAQVALSGMTGLGSVSNAAWTFAELAEDANALSLNWQSFDEQGNPPTVEGIGTIDTGCMRYLTPQMNAVAAFAVTPEYPWKALIDAFSQAMPREYAFALELVAPYLRAIDGTVLIASAVPTEDDCKAVADNFETSRIPAILMVHMKSEMIDEALALGRKVLDSERIPYQVKANGTCALTLGGGKNLEFGNVDGYLAIATVPLKTGTIGNLAGKFEDQASALSVNLPTLAPWLPQATFGVNLTVQAQKTDGKAVLKLTNADQCPLVALISLCND